MRRYPNEFIYLIHASGKHFHTQHYIGKTLDIPARMRTHKAGQGAKITKAWVEAGLTWEIARLWRGTSAIERKLKNFKNARLLCPVCNPKRALGKCNYEPDGYDLMGSIRPEPWSWSDDEPGSDDDMPY